MPPSIGQPPGIVAAILFLAFFAQALKEIGIPSPGLTQSLLIYAGYQFSGGGFLYGGGIVLLTLAGSLSGAGLVFCLSKYGGSRVLERLIRYTVITPEAVEKARNKISAHSFLSVALGRSVPGLMVPTSIVAGTLKMPIRKFLTGIIFPLSIWIILLTSLGNTFGQYIPQFSYRPACLPVLLGALIALAALLAGSLYHHRASTDLQSHKNKAIPTGQAKENE
jgi:membrane protein DedA with SNARE-associated domain